MKVLVLDGSGHSKGYTQEMCQQSYEVFVSSGMDCTVLPLGDVFMEHCDGCLYCRENRGCRLEDDIAGFYAELGELDLLLFATPIRFSGPSSILKTFMDRMNPFWYSDMGHPRYAAAMMCAGGKDPKFSNALSEMKALSFTMGMEWIGELEVPGTDLLRMEDVGAEAHEFAKGLVVRMRTGTRP